MSQQEDFFNPLGLSLCLDLKVSGTLFLPWLFQQRDDENGEARGG